MEKGRKKQQHRRTLLDEVQEHPQMRIINVQIDRKSRLAALGVFNMM